jgi:hypothetical protein
LLTRAFQGKQRQSAFTFRYKKHVILVLSGENTGGFEVQPLPISTGANVRVTSPERTLIVVTVRPMNAGGVQNVFQAFRRAQDRISIDKIISTLQKLEHVYPYHQAVGFYLERTGYPQHHLVRLKEIGMDLDFHLAHGMQETTYDKDWKLHYPRGL